MKRFPVFATVAVMAAAGAAGTAQAENPGKGKSPKTKPQKPAYCLPKAVGYHASGTLIAAQLTPSADTRKKDRYDGTLEVDVKRANHRGQRGPQTFTLQKARVRFGKDVDKTAPAAGSRVKLHGKITRMPKRCSTTGFTPTVTIKNVTIKKAKEKPAKKDDSQQA